MTWLKRNYSLAKYGLVGFLVGWVFYRHVLVSMVLALFFLLLPKEKTHDHQLRLEEFRLFLNNIQSELLIGYSLRSAMSLTLDSQVFRDQELATSLCLLNRSIVLGEDELDSWRKFSETMRDDYIRGFVDTLEATYHYSGDTTQVIGACIYAISDAINLSLEIDVIIAAKRFEFYTMMTVPVALLALLSYSQYDYMVVLYDNLLGRLVMSFVLLCMVIAYLVGKRLSRIEI